MTFLTLFISIKLQWRFLKFQQTICKTLTWFWTLADGFHRASTTQIQCRNLCYYIVSVRTHTDGHDGETQNDAVFMFSALRTVCSAVITDQTA